MCKKKVILNWDEYKKKAAQIVSEGCVLLQNKDDALPLKKGEKVSVFGRIQLHYYKSGTGSGGMVNVSKVYGILDGLKESGLVELNEELIKEYEKWEETHPFNKGIGWGTEPWSQEEMELSDDTVERASKFSDTAIIIVGRTAGEDKDFSDTKGAFRFSDNEEKMILKVSKKFSKVILLLNVGSLMNMSFIDEYDLSAVLVVWQGGMVGGLGTADVLTGKVCPSGRLTDTIVDKISDYPADKYFGGATETVYGEDIFVGYRYFETFCKDKVRYPFGYGLSYTSFDMNARLKDVKLDDRIFEVEAEITNTGKCAGKQVGMVFVKAPDGKLCKPEKVLTGFKKTKLLNCGEKEVICIECDFSSFSSFDDMNATEFGYSMVLEPGNYEVYFGENIRNSSKIGDFYIEKLLLIDKLSDAAGPVTPFKRLMAKRDEMGRAVEIYEDVPVYQGKEMAHREENLPDEIVQCFDNKITLSEVLDKKAKMEDFIATFTDEELACIVRGEGMGSSKVTPGTASALGGVSESLKAKKIPAVCCDDGPSGMRLDSGVKAFSAPNATIIACTFNPELVTELYEYMGLEMIRNRVENLLGPGMNIHRHPLNGRNFEYFSEDPYVTGVMGTAMLKGLKKNGVGGTVKHFCANNQEFGRNDIDSIVSERALREIYLKGFEMVVKSGYCDSVMTTYGRVNGIWTAGHYDLVTGILRDEWGFTGIVMTDWWAKVNERGTKESKNNTAAMVRAQNDLYMVVSDSENDSAKDNTLEQLRDGRLKRSELQRCAANICGYAMNSMAMKRMLGIDTEVEVVGQEDADEEFDTSSLEYIVLEDEITIDLTDKESVAGTNYYLPLDIQVLGRYYVTLTGSSELSELAQLPCTLYYTGVPFLTFTFNGTGGKSISIKKDMSFHNRMAVLRLNVINSGVKLEKITFKLKSQFTDIM